MPSPMPLAAPVTTATFPASTFIACPPLQRRRRHRRVDQTSLPLSPQTRNIDGTHTRSDSLCPAVTTSQPVAARPTTRPPHRTPANSLEEVLLVDGFATFAAGA